MLRRTVLWSSVFALVVGSSSLALAQKPKGKTLKIDATVDSVVPQGIYATSKADGKKFAIGFDGSSKVGLVGNASIDFITPGAYVQMTVEMDGEGKPAKPVDKVTVIQQDKLTQPGVMSTKGPDGKPGEPGPYLVRGTVKTNKNDELTIAAGGKQVIVKMSLGATVPVNLPNWQWAKPGDTLSGAGIEVAAGSGNAPAMIYGDQIEIKATLPITKPGKK